MPAIDAASHATHIDFDTNALAITAPAHANRFKICGHFDAVWQISSQLRCTRARALVNDLQLLIRHSFQLLHGEHVQRVVARRSRASETVIDISTCAKHGTRHSKMNNTDGSDGVTASRCERVAVAERVRYESFIYGKIEREDEKHAHTRHERIAFPRALPPCALD